MITHLEPDILECEVKWALENITMNKASGGDGIPTDLFQILKDDAGFITMNINYCTILHSLGCSHFFLIILLWIDGSLPLYFHSYAELVMNVQVILGVWLGHLQINNKTCPKMEIYVKALLGMPLGWLVSHSKQIPKEKEFIFTSGEKRNF